MSNVWEDYDLCMLEHLAYMSNDDGLKNALKEGRTYEELQDCDTVGDYLEQFDLTALRTENPNGYTNGDCINRCEYAAVIEYMLSKSNICCLSVNDTMENAHDNTCPLAYDFVYPEGSQENVNNEHIVIFKGTTEGFEWKDNVEGINQTDTQSQIEAAAFIDKIVSDDTKENINITVVGHSKGGNKAMYCAIVSDKVTRCVSMDGQGFSDEFIEKYQYKIIEKAGNIKNYSYSSDYVHALLIQIPGIEQIYVGDSENNNVNSVTECHSPNSLFSYYYDESGKLQVKESFQETGEATSIQIIHGIVEYIMHSDCEDKESLIQYLAYIVGCVGDNSEEFIDKVMNGEEVIDSEKLATILAYLVKYCKENIVSSNDIYNLLNDIQLLPVIQPVMDKYKDEFLSWCYTHNKLSLLNGILSKYNITALNDSESMICFLLDLILNYLYSNEDKQSYNLLKIAVMLADRVFDKNESHDKLYDSLWNTLENMKKQYNSIKYNASQKAVIYTDKLKSVSVISDFHEKSSLMLYYNISGIETALSKIKELDGLCIENGLGNLDSVSGKCAKSISSLNDMYDSMFKKLCTLLTQTRNQIQGIYDAVCALEN